MYWEASGFHRLYCIPPSNAPRDPVAVLLLITLLAASLFAAFHRTGFIGNVIIHSLWINPYLRVVLFPWFLIPDPAFPE